MNRPPPRIRASHIVLLAAILFGGALRWHHLGWENLWLDEAYSIDLARGPLARILAERWTDIHPPLYYIALHYWIPIAGHSEAGTRLLSVLFDLAAIVVTYAVSARLVGAGAGAAAAMLLAISPFHVEFAQEARMYTLLGLTSTLSMLGFVALAERRRPVAFFWYVIATTAMLYSHIYSLFILAAHGVAIALWLWRGERRETLRTVGAWGAAIVVVLVCYAPWIAVLINQATRVHSAFWIPRPTWDEGVSIFATYAGSERLALALGGLAGVGAVLAWRRTVARDLPVLAVLIPWLVSPILLPLVASWLATPIFQPKYAIAASIPFAVLAGYGLMRLPHVLLRGAAVILITYLAWSSLTVFYDARRREGWKNAVTTVESLAEPGDVLLFYPGFNHFPFDYYRTRDDLTGVEFPLEPLVPIPPPVPLGEMLRATVGEKPRVWLIALQGARERVPIAEGLARERTQLQHIVGEWIEMDLFERQK